MITTTKGLMDESKLIKKTGSIDNENELTQWIEYYCEEELVHRSAHVQLKKNIVSSQSLTATF
jgi:predicted nucleotide-binding protein (sugar kinase/HSP70/actin superfamily)